MTQDKKRNIVRVTRWVLLGLAVVIPVLFVQDVIDENAVRVLFVVGFVIAVVANVLLFSLWREDRRNPPDEA